MSDETITATVTLPESLSEEAADAAEAMLGAYADGRTDVELQVLTVFGGELHVEISGGTDDQRARVGARLRSIVEAGIEAERAQ